MLIVDDNADARELLRAALNDAGHLVATAGNGLEAADVAADFKPGIGILDIGLPGMNGYELARCLRNAHDGIKLIALTGYVQQTDREAATAAGSTRTARSR